MVVHVCPRGSDGPGLTRYLYGPGKRNEHTDQHMVFGSHMLDMAYPGQLSSAEASNLGHLVEASWRAQFREQLASAGVASRGVSSADRTLPGAGSEDVDADHMYHFVISIPAGQEWSDEQWAEAGWAMVRGLGFSQGPDDLNGCKVIGVRHGKSAKGNDHMHIAVNLVREDGQRAALPKYDYAKVQNVARRVEKQLDFIEQLHDDSYVMGASLPAYTQAEARAAEAAGLLAPDRVLLQQVVRSSALSATTEAAWINAVLDHPGVSLEAAQFEGGAVTGYLVQIGDGEKFAGYQLAPDLTLARMRTTWHDETAESRAEAAALWREEKAPEETLYVEHVGPELHAAARELSTWTNTVTARAATADEQEWSEMVRTQAGLAATLARADDRNASELTHAADVWSREAARLPRISYGPSRAQVASRQLQLALRSGSPSGHEGWLAVLRQVRQTSAAMSAAAHARGELAAARQLAGLPGQQYGQAQGAQGIGRDPHRPDGTPAESQSISNQRRFAF